MTEYLSQKIWRLALAWYGYCGHLREQVLYLQLCVLIHTSTLRRSNSSVASGVYASMHAHNSNRSFSRTATLVLVWTNLTGCICGKGLSTNTITPKSILFTCNVNHKTVSFTMLNMQFKSLFLYGNVSKGLQWVLMQNWYYLTASIYRIIISMWLYIRQLLLTFDLYMPGVVI